MNSQKQQKINQLSTRSLYVFDRFISKRKKFDISDSILVAGAPRSGTTWLMELFEKIPGYTYVFEPFQPEWFPDSLKTGFKNRLYLLPDMNWLEGEEYLKQIFTGKIVSLSPFYISKISMLGNRIFSNKLIVKSVRITRLLPWVEKRFELKNIFFIIRHPCAVVASQLKTGITGYQYDVPPYDDRFPTLKEIIKEASQMDFIKQSLIEKLKKIDSQEEILATTWCLDNIVPLNQKNTKWQTLIYEKLVSNGEIELKHIFEKISEKKSLRSAIDHMKTPSLLTFNDAKALIKNSNLQLSKWKKSLSKKQVERIIKIISDFDLDFYTEENEPNYGKITF
ncbi:hypothetical protein AYK24_01865 [Thermoplasmatales archaeon SG8-52-4]|nr:MAG: hypothetical protein AYK24_01865 [Thermoplasmatales archaeon SG8-52-4]